MVVGRVDLARKPPRLTSFLFDLRDLVWVHQESSSGFSSLSRKSGAAKCMQP
jgi:hypothetical protein